MSTYLRASVTAPTDLSVPSATRFSFIPSFAAGSQRAIVAQRRLSETLFVRAASGPPMRLFIDVAAANAKQLAVIAGQAPFGAHVLFLL